MMWKYLKQNKKETVLAPLFKMLEACFELFIPLLVADIIDVGIKNSDTAYIIKRGILMVFFGVAGFVFSAVAQYFSAKSAIGVSRELRKDLFYHITELNYSRLDDLGTSALITGMTSDINQVQNGVNWVLRLLLRSPFIVIGAAVMSCTISLAAAAIFWTTILILLIIILVIMRITTALNLNVQRNLEKVTRSFRENLLGVRVIRAFNRQPSEQEAFDLNHAGLYESQIKSGRISALLNPLTFAVVNLSIAVILYAGAFQVNIGNLSQGEVIALFNYMSQILVELIKFVNVVVLVSKAAASFKRVQLILQVKPSLCGGDVFADHTKPADIKFENVCFSYSLGANYALNNITCRIPAGAKVGITGPTGSGKSTFVNLVAGFYKCTEGIILLNDVPIENYDTGSLAESVSLAPQKSALVKGDLRSNLKWGNEDASDDECLRALESSGSLEFVMKKGHGLGLKVEQNGRNFSGGQRQRLAIARALLKQSGLLILDDSYSALDYATEAKIKKSVLNDKKNCTVITVSQRISSVYNSDFILVFDKGCLVGRGTHERLYKECPVYNEICRSQNFS